MGQPVVYFEIAGKDAGKLSDFYSNLFDWNVTNTEIMENMDYRTVDTGGGDGIGGGIFQAKGDIPSYLTVYVQVDDLQAYLNKVESLGGKAITPPIPIEGVGSVAMLTDPEGNIVGLFKPLEE